MPFDFASTRAIKITGQSVPTPQDDCILSFFTLSDEWDPGIQGRETAADDYPALHDTVPAVVTDKWPSRTFDDIDFRDSIKGKKKQSYMYSEAYPDMDPQVIFT